MQIETFQKKPWIGVDLDGTLAVWEEWGKAIGAPVPAMMHRVRAWLDAGIKVKIFTARAADPELIPAVRDWLSTHGLQELEITNAKDTDMVEMWDDRAVTVVRNTGVAVRLHY